MAIAIYSTNKPTNSYSQEATMKKCTAMLEDLWVAVAFAEAGVSYEPAIVQELQPRCQDAVRAHTA
jgi:hypothetical protein